MTRFRDSYASTTAEWRYLLVTLFAALIGSLCGALLNPPVTATGAATFFSTLATIEASIFAIVFSVIVIAIRLVANKYSSRLPSIFLREPLYRITFTLFVIAIAVNLLGLYLSPLASQTARNAWVGMSAGIAAVSIATLYRFIRTVITRSTPEGVITAIVERELDPQAYVPRYESERPSDREHPHLVLFSLTSEAIEEGELETAEQGVDGFGSVLDDTLEYVNSEENRVDDEVVNGIFKHVLEHYFPILMLAAADNHRTDLSSDLAEISQRVGERGLETEHQYLAEYSATGLADVFDELPQSFEVESFRQKIYDTLLELSLHSAEQADYKTFREVFRSLDNQLTVYLRRTPEIDYTERVVSDHYLGSTKKILDPLLERYGNELKSSNLDWMRSETNDKSEFPIAAKSLRYPWRRRTSFTQTVLQYRVNTGQYPFAEGNISDGWKPLIEKSAEASLPGLATLYCISMIRAAYAVWQIEERLIGRWTIDLALIRRDVDEDIVDRAFELVVNGTRPRSGNISHSFGGRDQDREQGLISRILGNDSQRTGDLESWAEEYHQNVIDKTKSMKED